MTILEAELILVVRNRQTGKRYSMLERRTVDTAFGETRVDTLVDMVEEMVDRPVTARMLEVEREG